MLTRNKGSKDAFCVTRGRQVGSPLSHNQWLPLTSPLAQLCRSFRASWSNGHPQRSTSEPWFPLLCLKASLPLKGVCSFTLETTTTMALSWSTAWKLMRRYHVVTPERLERAIRASLCHCYLWRTTPGNSQRYHLIWATQRWTERPHGFPL